MGALDDLAEDLGLDNSSTVQKGAVATFFTAPAAYIVKVVLQTFILQPAAFTLGTLDRIIGATWGSVTGGIRFALENPAELIRGAFLRPCSVEGKPCGLIPLYFESTVGSMTTIGLPAPIATAIANLIAVGALVLIGYGVVAALTGGTSVSSSTAILAAARRLL